MGTPHPDATRAAVLAALLAGQSASAASREFNIPRSTVMRWYAESDARHAVDTVGQERDAELGELVIDHVAAALRTLEAIARTTATPEWIQKQSAENLAVFYGVMSDKAHRVLASLEPARDELADDSDDRV